ncbi:TPA: MobF family relaxase [Escherichia coli]
MMSIAQVRSAGSAGNYYTDKDNYYVLGSMGERWAGQGAEQLGLQGSVDKDVFTRLLEGRLPDGADLSRMQDGRNRHRPGYDLTFSAPKSVSMMAMLGGDKRLIEAHNQAVDFAVRQVEALASTRVMTDGQSETVLTGNLVMALFNHDTSRDQEPQLHTHAVVANVTQHTLGMDELIAKARRFVRERFRSYQTELKSRGIKRARARRDANRERQDIVTLVKRQLTREISEGRFTANREAVKREVERRVKERMILSRNRNYSRLATASP